MGLERKALAPAFRASSSMELQSYAVMMIMVVSGPTNSRTLRVTSMPSISGIFQSMRHTSYSSPVLWAARTFSTHSVPVSTQWDRMPRFSRSRDV